MLTGGYDNSRTNAITSETSLTTANVNGASFGRLFALDADGQIYAQPLYMHGVSIAGKGTHNVVFIATLHNSVYAYDADTPNDPLWIVNLGPSASTGAIGFNDVTPEVGILGTPVIDSSTNTLYAVAETYESGLYYHKLHALDLSSGQEKFGGPEIISGSVTGTGSGSQNGVLQFSSVLHLQRPALLLLNGVVYIAFGSHADQGAYHGWLFGYSASNVKQQTAVFNTTPNGEQGAIWQGGRGPAADSSGYIYVATGNGEWDGTTNFAQSFLKLDPTRSLAIADWFTTASWQGDSEVDDDFGSSGAALLPGTSYLIGGDKGGAAYVAAQDDLGHLTNDDTGIHDQQQVIGYGIFNFAVWNNNFYSQAEKDSIKVFAIVNGRISMYDSSQTAAEHVVAYDGYSVSSNGTVPGSAILWATTSEVKGTVTAAGTLHAFDATNLGRELWNSDMVPNRDTLGWFAKFANPTVANGKVYVPTFSNRLLVYGRLPASGISGIANLASLENVPVSPGELITVFGNGMGPQTAETAQPSAQLPTTLGGTQLFFDGNAAPLVETSAARIYAVVPSSVAGKTATSVEVEYNGVRSAAFVVTVSEAAPGIFSANQSGVGPAEALNADFSVNSPTNAAARGSVVYLYATGEGLTNPPTTDGALAFLQPPYPVPNLPITVTVGGEPAQILYAGPSPTFDLLDEISAVLAPNTPTGTVPLQVTIGTRTAASGMTITVK